MAKVSIFSSPLEDEEYIRKADAINIFKRGEKYYGDTIADMINDLEPVQFDLVRCKDCIHANFNLANKNICYCKTYGTYFHEYDFCSLAERGTE